MPDGNAPDWCDTPELQKQWHNPHGDTTRKFRRRCRMHGLLSPHFSIAEFASRSDGCGCAAKTPGLRQQRRLQKLCFRLEKVRHRLGGPITIVSGLRSNCHNDCVGGASLSQHKYAKAADVQPGAGVGQGEFNSEMEKEFQHGGIGRGCVTGNVMHVDIGPERRWCYAGS